MSELLTAHPGKITIAGLPVKLHPLWHDQLVQGTSFFVTGYLSIRTFILYLVHYYLSIGTSQLKPSYFTLPFYPKIHKKHQGKIFFCKQLQKLT